MWIFWAWKRRALPSTITLSQKISMYYSSIFPVPAAAIDASPSHEDRWADAAFLAGTGRLRDFALLHDIVGASCNPIHEARLDSDLSESALLSVGCSDSLARSQ